eukprot:gb/GECG01006491.1/.p1 GENE.gb/GECG01006491.1/~~gb/GECG01006491.1/.p1  ORF type:complete len:133 (+),score=13.34 gb/GECG01006491.1/:1-399(+)
MSEFWKTLNRPPGPVKFFLYAGGAFVLERIAHGVIQPYMDEKRWQETKQRMEQNDRYLAHWDYMDIHDYRKRRYMQTGERRLLSTDFSWDQLEGAPAPAYNDRGYDATHQQQVEARETGSDKSFAIRPISKN